MVGRVGEGTQLPLVWLFLFVGNETEVGKIVMGFAERRDLVGVVLVAEGESGGMMELGGWFIATGMGAETVRFYCDVLLDRGGNVF